MKTITFLTILLAVTATALAAAPATQPVPSAQPVKCKVVKIVGMVQYAALGKNNWTSAKAGDVLDAGNEIRTGLRSSVLLRLHETTLIQIKSATRVALTELARSSSSEKSRMFLHYGTVRGGIIEGQYHSDFQIACPAAVLSREGTWGFEISYDPATGHFYIGLDTEGLVRVTQFRTGKSIVLSPSQFVTQAMQLWVQTATFQRTVQLTDPFGTTTIEQLVNALNPDGRNPADPTNQGSAQNTFGSGSLGNPRLEQSQLQGQITNLQTLNLLNQQFNQISNSTYDYRFGNFGTHIPDTAGSTALKHRK